MLTSSTRALQRGRPSRGIGTRRSVATLACELCLQRGRPRRGVRTGFRVDWLSVWNSLQLGRLLRRRWNYGHLAAVDQSADPSTWTSPAETLLLGLRTAHVLDDAPSMWTSPVGTLLLGGLDEPDDDGCPSTWTLPQERWNIRAAADSGACTNLQRGRPHRERCCRLGSPFLFVCWNLQRGRSRRNIEACSLAGTPTRLKALQRGTPLAGRWNDGDAAGGGPGHGPSRGTPCEGRWNRRTRSGPRAGSAFNVEHPEGALERRVIWGNDVWDGTRA
ncbi:hypothetical protein F4561_002198 [Lipingzhangella halophila]|uniref:Uncharacterized protein n=1 Tax=Lipingzhangella halophila TaxID=1783352 RepID=A0A7W7W2E8_9ACTN|nr:hypothetical protein [Lipingzhangella halophila]